MQNFNDVSLLLGCRGVVTFNCVYINLCKTLITWLSTGSYCTTIPVCFRKWNITPYLCLVYLFKDKYVYTYEPEKSEDGTGDADFQDSVKKRVSFNWFLLLIKLGEDDVRYEIPLLDWSCHFCLVQQLA